jgi:hypothetical protein
MEQKPLKERLKENHSVMRDIFQLLKENKKWWLLPFFIVLFLVSLFGVLVGGSSILPAIYALF